MKKILLLLLITFSAFISKAQLTTINPDTVCYQTPGSIYQVPATVGYTYAWVVSNPGIIVSGQGTNTLGVNWSLATPGLIPNGVTLTVTNAFGCVATIDIDVFILNVIPVIAPLGPFCLSDPCVPLNAVPIGGVFSGVGVVGNTFCPPTSGVGTYNITYTYTVNGCVFTDIIPVTVNPLPTLSPIQHN